MVCELHIRYIFYCWPENPARTFTRTVQYSKRFTPTSQLNDMLGGCQGGGKKYTKVNLLSPVFTSKTDCVWGGGVGGLEKLVLKPHNHVKVST